MQVLVFFLIQDFHACDNMTPRDCMWKEIRHSPHSCLHHPLPIEADYSQYSLPIESKSLPAEVNNSTFES